MFNLLKKYYIALESLRGRQLFVIIAAIFLIFILVGFVIGYINIGTLNKSESSQTPTKTAENVVAEKNVYSGIVTFLGSSALISEGISYSLVDSTGKEIILLKSSDDKLAISEGLFAKVSGRLEKTSSGKESVLFVEEVTISRGSN